MGKQLRFSLVFKIKKKLDTKVLVSFPDCFTAGTYLKRVKLYLGLFLLSLGLFLKRLFWFLKSKLYSWMGSGGWTQTLIIQRVKRRVCYIKKIGAASLNSFCGKTPYIRSFVKFSLRSLWKKGITKFLKLHSWETVLFFRIN